MEQPDTDVFYAEAVDGVLGDGTRIYTSRDTVYEAWHREDVDARIYGEEGNWTAAVRFPDTDEVNAFERWTGLGDRLAGVYGTDHRVEPVTFHETVDADSGVVHEDGDIRMHYTQDGVSFEDADDGTKALIAYTGGGTLTGAVGAGTAGLAMGSPELALFGAMGGYIAGFGLALPYEEVMQRVKPEWSLTQHFRERARTKKHNMYGLGRKLLDDEFRDDLNTQNSIAARMNEEWTLEGKEEYDRLKDADLDDELKDVLDTAFRTFDRWEGVTVSTTTETYGDAHAFIGTALDERLPAQERPSIYTNPDAFIAILDYLPPSDIEVVVRNAVDRGIPEDIQELLEEEHPDVVARVGQEHSLERSG